jgi:hypothetical protein
MRERRERTGRGCGDKMIRSKREKKKGLGLAIIHRTFCGL